MSNVYYTNLRSRPGRSLPKKMELLVKAAGIGDLPCKDKFTAIKIHFGELGNMAFLRHNYAARMAELLKQMGARPFLTDTNTLYSGSRSNAVDHLYTAFLNGYNAISVPAAPVIIAGWIERDGRGGGSAAGRGVLQRGTYSLGHCPSRCTGEHDAFQGPRTGRFWRSFKERGGWAVPALGVSCICIPIRSRS